MRKKDLNRKPKNEFVFWWGNIEKKIIFLLLGSFRRKLQLLLKNIFI